MIFEKIPIKNLVSCQDYQRSLSESQIQKIAKEFDLHQINPVKVSRRDGVNYVFDGQHTIEAVALVSHSRDTPVWCMISMIIFAMSMKRTSLPNNKRIIVLLLRSIHSTLI